MLPSYWDSDTTSVARQIFHNQREHLQTHAPMISDCCNWSKDPAWAKGIVLFSVSKEG
jgi:hypothetical protein